MRYDLTLGFLMTLVVILSCKSKQQLESSKALVAEGVRSAPPDLLNLIPDWRQDPWDYKRVAETIRAKNIRTVDELLETLPGWLNSSFTLIHNSSDGEEATSLEMPRVVLFSPDARFILTYNVNPTVNHVRIAQFVDREERLALYEISFDPSGKSAPKFSRENPSDCLGCHNSDPKHHIQQYDKWSGWYGSDDDTIADGSAEDIGLQKLRKMAQSNGRLKNLSFPEDFPNYPYHRKDPTSPKNSEGRGFSSMPNTRLTTALMRLQARIIHRRIKQHPNYDLIAPVLAFAKLESKSDVIQMRPKDNQNCFSGLKSAAGRILPQFDISAAMSAIGSKRRFSAKFQDRRALLHAIYEASGVSYEEEMDLGYLIKATQGIQQNSAFAFMDGFFGIEDIVLDLVWRDLVQMDRRLNPYHNPQGMSAGVEFAAQHWGSEARYNRDYHFRQEQREIFDGIAVAMVSPKGESSMAMSSACGLLDEWVLKRLATKRSATSGEAAAASGEKISN